MGLLIIALVWLLILAVLLKGLLVLWHKMHALVGIEVGYPNEALLLSHQPSVAVPVNVPSKSKLALSPLNQPKTRLKKSRQPYWHTRHGNIPSLVYLTGVNVDNIDRMPSQAVNVLISINERLAQYLSWQQQAQSNATDSTLTQNWLTEKQFVIERLITQTIPEAVAQYDQLARFNPQRLSQPIHDDMTAGEMLVAVLRAVDEQLLGVLDETFEQASLQLASTYRYVKSRTQNI